MDSLLDVKGLCKYLDGQIVLGACSFSLAPGHITGLLGPNGAGKSTLLRSSSCWRRVLNSCLGRTAARKAKSLFRGLPSCSS